MHLKSFFASLLLLPTLFGPALSIPQHGFFPGGKVKNGKTSHERGINPKDVPAYFVTDASKLGVTASTVPAAPAPVTTTGIKPPLASTSTVPIPNIVPPASSPIPTVTPHPATAPAGTPPPPPTSSVPLAASDFYVKYPNDTINLKACALSPNPVPSTCLVNYHTNDKWFGQGNTGNYGVLLSFNYRCEPEGPGNWYVTRDDLRKGVDLDVGLASKGKMFATFDPAEFTWSYGGKNYTITKDHHYSGSPKSPQAACYLSTTGSQTNSTYEMWQIPYDC